MDPTKLAIAGGAPVRTKPLPLEFPGVHHFDCAEIESVARVLHARSPFRYYGVDLQNEVAGFEAEFAEATGARHALAVTSGTGALHVALAALGAGPGQEVVVPAYGWVSIFAAVVNNGAVPVLADIDDTFCLDPAALERAISPRTAGVVMVHMSGAPGDVRAVREVTRRHGLFLLEDCAQCAGGTLDGQSVGTFGEAGIFSFQMNKNMTAGEGGCVVTDETGLFRRAFAWHDLGYARDENGRLALNEPDLCLWGRGYRLDELRAAVLRIQLRKLPRIVESMRRSKRRIRAAVERFPGVVRLRRVPDPAGDTGAFLITTFKDRGTAVWVNRALRAEGIVPGPQGISNILMTDWGLHLYYSNASLLARSGWTWRLAENAAHHKYEKGACPVADDLFERSTLLAVPSCLSEQDEADVIRAFDKVLSAVEGKKS